MKLAAPLAVLLLAGCTSYGSWLDSVGSSAATPVPVSAEQSRDLAQQLAVLRGKAEQVRVRLAHEQDRRQRFRFYEELAGIGDEVAYLERRLRGQQLPPGDEVPPGTA